MQLQIDRSVVLPIVLGLAIGVASFLSGDWSPWVVGFFGILAFLYVVFSLDTFRLSKSWLSIESLLAIMLGIMIVSICWSTSYYLSIRAWTYILLGVLTFLAARSVLLQYTRQLLSWFVFVATFGAAWAIGEQIWNDIYRAEGFLQNANALGGFLIIALPIACGLGFHAYRWKRWVFWTCAVVITLALLRSFSITSVVGLIIGAGICVSILKLRIFTFRRIAIGATVLFCTVLFGVAIRSVQLHSFQQGVRLDQVITATHFSASFSQRWNFVKSSIAMAVDHPLQGVGLGVFQLNYPQYAYTLHEQPRYAHNAYIELAAEAGIISCIAFIIALYYMMKEVVKRMKTESSETSLAPWIACALFASIVNSLFDFSWHFLVVWFGFWLLAGLGVGPYFSVGTKLRSESIAKWVLLTLGLTLLVRGLGSAFSFTAFQRGERAFDNGYPYEATVYYRKGLQWDPNPQRMKELSESLWVTAKGNQQNLLDAQTAADSAIWWARADYFSWRMAARVAFARKDLMTADRNFREAIRLDQYFHPDIYLEYGNFLKIQKRNSEARTLLQGVVNAYSSDFWTSNPTIAGSIQIANAMLREIPD